MVYFLTYMAYTIIHLEKQYWSFSKSVIVKYHSDITKKDLSKYDTAQLFCYGISLYVCGILGDTFNQRIVLTSGLTGMAVLYSILAVIAFTDVLSPAPFYIVLSGMGLLNSTLLTCMIDINSNLFPKNTRGLLIVLWMS